MNNITIIGISGRAGAGKDTLADHLVANHGYERLAIADPIKDGIAIMFGIERSAFDDRARKEVVIPWLGKSPRQLAQLAGTEFGRGMVSDDVWLRVAEQKLVPGKRYVLSDVRFENEADFIRRNGGVVVHLERPGTESATASSAHASEAGIQMKSGDLWVLNAGSVDDLLSRAERLLGISCEFV